MIKELLAALEAKHGKKLDPQNETYFLFAKDGVVTYTVEDHEEIPGEKTLKFDVTLSDLGTIHHYEDKSLSIVELMKKGEL